MRAVCRNPVPWHTAPFGKNLPACLPDHAAAAATPTLPLLLPPLQCLGGVCGCCPFTTSYPPTMRPCCSGRWATLEACGTCLVSVAGCHTHDGIVLCGSSLPAATAAAGRRLQTAPEACGSSVSEQGATSGMLPCRQHRLVQSLCVVSAAVQAIKPCSVVHATSAQLVALMPNGCVSMQLRARANPDSCSSPRQLMLCVRQRQLQLRRCCCHCNWQAPSCRPSDSCADACWLTPWGTPLLCACCCLPAGHHGGYRPVCEDA